MLIAGKDVRCECAVSIGTALAALQLYSLCVLRRKCDVELAGVF